MPGRRNSTGLSINDSGKEAGVREIVDSAVGTAEPLNLEKRASSVGRAATRAILAPAGEGQREESSPPYRALRRAAPLCRNASQCQSYVRENTLKDRQSPRLTVTAPSGRMQPSESCQILAYRGGQDVSISLLASLSGSAGCMCCACRRESLRCAVFVAQHCMRSS